MLACLRPLHGLLKLEIESAKVHLVVIPPLLAPDKRRANIHRQARKKSAPGIAHRHAGKLPYEQHDPVSQTGCALVTEDYAAHAFQFAVGKALVQLLAVGDVVEDGLGLDGGYDGPDGADEGGEPEGVAPPDLVWHASPRDGCHGCAGAEGGLGLGV